VGRSQKEYKEEKFKVGKNGTGEGGENSSKKLQAAKHPSEGGEECYIMKRGN